MYMPHLCDLLPYLPLDMIAHLLCPTFEYDLGADLLLLIVITPVVTVALL